MKIKSITTTLIHIPYEAGAPTKLAGQNWSQMAILLVRVDTDQGVTGWGEGFWSRHCARHQGDPRHHGGGAFHRSRSERRRSAHGGNVPAAASLRPQRFGDL